MNSAQTADHRPSGIGIAGLWNISQGAITMKKVLLATDGSSFADEAAWFLAHLPHSDQLELIVLTVIEPPSIRHGYAPADWIEESVQREKTHAAETLKKVKQMFAGANVNLRHVVEQGNRGETIVHVAKEQAVDLVVIGARGHSAVTRLLLGSTSDFVATHAQSSVLVVRPTGIRQSDRPLRIAVGYEPSGARQQALDEFAEIRWGRQADVNLVSVISFVTGFLNEVVIDPEPIRKAATATVESALDELSGSAPTATAHVVESDHVGEGLVRFVEVHHCDLVVVGEKPRSLLGRVLLGSISRFVLRHAPCSVWITRARVAENANQSAHQSQTAST